MNQDHFDKLERMYLSANFNREIYESTTIKITEEQALVSLDIDSKYFHALGAIHGSVYFKLLDDASFFAVNSIVEDYFVLTTSFNISLTAPANKGTITAKGKVKMKSKNLYMAEASLFNDKGKEIAFGTGQFVKSRIELTDEIGYR